jgi:glycerol-3-phosphate dehydrogenase
MNLVTQPLIPDYAVGLPMADRTATSNGAGSNGSRLLFITPWRNRSLIGTSQTQYLGDPDDLRVTEEEVQEFIDQVNSTFPAARLRPEDICFFHAGLVPMEGEGTGRSATLGRKYRIYDHSLDEGLEGLISVCSVKFTEARHVSEEVINLVFEKLGKKPARTLTTHTAVHGGAIERFGEFLAEEEAKKPQGLSSDITKHLICNYGARYPRLFEYFDEDAALRETVSHPSPVLRAEVVHGVREEMAQKLTDVVLRRTELGMSGDPGTECLATCAGIMAKELNWSEAKIHQEIHEARNAFALAQPHG